MTRIIPVKQPIFGDFPGLNVRLVLTEYIYRPGRVAPRRPDLRGLT